MSVETVNCRAQESDRCLDGWPLSKAYPGHDHTDDITWNGTSLVCDECFIALGCPDPHDVAERY